MIKRDIKKIVKDNYSKIAKEERCSCCSLHSDVDIARFIGYTDEEIALASDANLAGMWQSSCTCKY
jgi:hypothetical protein